MFVRRFIAQPSIIYMYDYAACGVEGHRAGYAFVLGKEKIINELGWVSGINAVEAASKNITEPNDRRQFRPFLNTDGLGVVCGSTGRFLKTSFIVELKTPPAERQNTRIFGMSRTAACTTISEEYPECIVLMVSKDSQREVQEFRAGVSRIRKRRGLEEDEEARLRRQIEELAGIKQVEMERLERERRRREDELNAEISEKQSRLNALLGWMPSDCVEDLVRELEELRAQNAAYERQIEESRVDAEELESMKEKQEENERKMKRLKDQFPEAHKIFEARRSSSQLDVTGDARDGTEVEEVPSDEQSGDNLAVQMKNSIDDSQAVPGHPADPSLPLSVPPPGSSPELHEAAEPVQLPFVVLYPSPLRLDINFERGEVDVPQMSLQHVKTVYCLVTVPQVCLFVERRTRLRPVIQYETATLDQVRQSNPKTLTPDPPERHPSTDLAGWASKIKTDWEDEIGKTERIRREIVEKKREVDSLIRKRDELWESLGIQPGSVTRNHKKKVESMLHENAVPIPTPVAQYVVEETIREEPVTLLMDAESGNVQELLVQDFPEAIDNCLKDLQSISETVKSLVQLHKERSQQPADSAERQDEEKLVSLSGEAWWLSLEVQQLERHLMFRPLRSGVTGTNFPSAAAQTGL
uniref:Uncharacterized protein n=1 Tax=Chromera velia CCMP2878 TaxID=1169474 RepID=A0A0G4I2Z6_9ALVE|eukprot:Cvel_10539.t1-p1 / transcript=Cvel_10539.t1 / gene=Cvel_10539 / organism=Chromera_velia_CCMP2878 / gene_product=hypothetical protein / transcript_product=hypothetical protein / location=Cvel_scaffold638:19150-21255(-) / protein_length=639 / sequence_SO=supercontig / SO=protein_coding / is_pseudo=false